MQGYAHTGTVPMHAKRGAGYFLTKTACTCVSLLMVTSQVAAVPVHAPVQLLKRKPVAGAALKEMVVPCVTVEAHAHRDTGAIFEPAKWFSMTVDYYNVKKSKLIVAGTSGNSIVSPLPMIPPGDL